MKITAKQYAQALYELVAQEDISNVSKILKNFVVFLAKKGDLKLANKIIKDFEIIWNNKNGIAEVEVTTVDKLDKEMIVYLKENIAQWLNKKEIEIKEKIDKDIFNGIILKYKDLVVDGSLRKKIDLLASKLQGNI